MCTAANKGNKLDAGCFQITHFAWSTVKTLNGIRLIIIWIRIKLRLLKWRHLSFGKKYSNYLFISQIVVDGLSPALLTHRPQRCLCKSNNTFVFFFSNDLIKAQCVEKQWSGNSSLCHKPSWRIKRIVVTPIKTKHFMFHMFSCHRVCGQLDLSKVFFTVGPLIK